MLGKAPALRFPGFNEPWKKFALGEIVSFEKKRIHNYDLRLTEYVSTDNMLADFGGIRVANRISETGTSTSFIKGDILVSNIRPYLNKIWCATFDGGCSPDVFVYRAKKELVTSPFLYNILANNAFITYVMNGAKGVKMPRGDKEQMMKYPCSIPTLQEQDKISSLLQFIDERITTQRRLIEDFISLRRAILQDAIKKGLSKKSWKFTTLNEILTERGERNSNGYDVCSVSVSEGVVNQIEYLGRSFAAKETGHYNVARYGDIIYTKSPTGSFPYGIVKRNTQKEPAAISPLYGVFVPIHDWMGMLLGYYFESEVNTFNYLHPIIQKGAKNTINITNSGFLANSVPLPTSESESLTLAKCLDTITHKIVLEKSVLANYANQREYLLSKMFV